MNFALERALETRSIEKSSPAGSRDDITHLPMVVSSRVVYVCWCVDKRCCPGSTFPQGTLVASEREVAAALLVLGSILGPEKYRRTIRWTEFQVNR